MLFIIALLLFLVQIFFSQYSIRDLKKIDKKISLYLKKADIIFYSRERLLELQESCDDDGDYDDGEEDDHVNYAPTIFSYHDRVGSAINKLSLFSDSIEQLYTEKELLKIVKTIFAEEKLDYKKIKNISRD